MIHNTLSVLINDSNGIKNYLNRWDEQDNSPRIIEMIFNKLILTKFVAEYQEIITYRNSSNINYYQNLVFNMKDLMCTIFEFFNYVKNWQGDLFNCSLVCSHWLYHVYNTSLFDIVGFGKLIQNTVYYNYKNNGDVDGDDNNCIRSGALRTWHRLSKLKSLYFGLIDTDHDTTKASQTAIQLLLDKLLIVGNVKKLDGTCTVKHLEILKRIMSQCKDNIEHYSFKIGSREKNVLSPLTSPNAKYVSIRCSYFYIIWSNKCEN